MKRWFARTMWLGLMGGIGAAVYVMAQRRRAAGQADAPVWPPLSGGGDVRPFAEVQAEPVDNEPVQAEPVQVDPVQAETGQRRWVEAIDGDCPDGYPIKANDSSGIFHMPGGRFYNRTTPERCYAKADDAVTDGYRPAKA